MSKGLRAILAWPFGVVLWISSMFLNFSQITPTSCEPPHDVVASSRSCAFEPEPWWAVAFTLCLLLGPGVIATWAWWVDRRRRVISDEVELSRGR